MKNLTLTLLFLGLFSGLSAQFVTIPDVNFRRELVRLYPGCFNANQEMDTTCSAVVNELGLIVNSLQVSNLDGVQYFDSLQYLYCPSNQLTNLPALPSGLRYLECHHNQLTSLPALPSGLRDLRCNSNQLTSLPTLPDSLRQLECHYNQLTSLPALPNVLEYLWCFDNQLTSLPALPRSLQQMGCNGNQLTSLPALPRGVQYLECHYNQLTSLPTLPDSLRYLTCNNNQLTSLPALPSNLAHLRCEYNQLTSLPTLPNSLRDLWCHENELTSLPGLPNSLYLLHCYQNQLTGLPVLPNGLKELACGYNQLTALPTLPNGLQSLSCHFTQLTSLPLLSDSLKFLDCYYNQLMSLPALPSKLQRLSCGNNQLTSLPALPDSLLFLEFSANQIMSLSALPSGLRDLSCTYNQLTSLPALPRRLQRLSCWGNTNLSCLPLLPNTLSDFQFFGTAITCLPNYTTSITQASTGLPLCNPSQVCEVNPMVRGVVFNDTNNNGLQDTLETLAGNIPLMVSPNNWTGISDTISGYLMKLDTLPTTNTLAVGSVPYRTFAPSSYAVTATGLGMVSARYDFAMRAQANITDLVTHTSTWFHRPGFQTSFHVNVENMGTIDQTNASISLAIPNGLTVISTIPANGVVTGNTVTWSGESIAIFERKSYSVSLQVPATMPLGTSLTYTAQATPASTDFTPADNIATETVVVRGSYDPNDKLVNKDRLPNNYVAADEEMLYTIRFQNTGTDTAFTVLIRDTLDLQKLDFSTFRVTGASHALRTNARDHGVVEFVFNNINLPDSFVNEPLSHGFVQFRIHPKANLPLGTQIKNRAFIYFDFNAPIITNFATTTVGLLSVNSAELGAGSLSLYPVPVAEQLTVNFNAVRSGEVRYRLLDLQGRLLQEQQLSVIEGENISTMDMGQLGAGMYLLQVVGEQGSVSQKVIKE